jgi:hypothetical protein
MARIKKVYDAGDLVEVVKTHYAGTGSLDQIKPGKVNMYEHAMPRQTRLFVVRHESGTNAAFAGSILCISCKGIIWIDARRVALVVDKDGIP